MTVPLANAATPDAGEAADQDWMARRSDVVRKPPATMIAAIDVGTNSIHLVMAEISPEGDFHVLSSDKDMVQLGKGGFREHVLTAAAMDAGIDTLKRFKKMAELKGVTKMRAVATSAVREARNGGDFVDRVMREIGLDLRVISPQEEGRLIYLGVRNAVDLGDRDNLIIDIGGGSVEIIVANAGAARSIDSVKLGGSRLAELHLKTDPPTEADLKELRRAIRRRLDPVVAAMPTVVFARCIGTSGTIKSLALLVEKRPGSAESPSPTTSRLTHASIKTILAELTARTRAQRLKMPGMDARRVDALIPAAMLLATLMRSLNIETIEHCDFALREGVIVDYIGSHRRKLLARATWPDPRTRSVVQLAERCHYRKEHADQTAKLALQLFDQLQALHNLGPEYRELLRFAAMLHDVGYLVSHAGHHKHSYYLIRNGGLKGFEDQEIEIIANVARYHRKERPKKAHYSYRQLTPDHRRPVKRLSILLRLADALDRTQYAVVDAVKCEIGNEAVTIEVQVNKDAELELWTARKHTELFEREFKRPLVIRAAEPPAAGETIHDESGD